MLPTGAKWGEGVIGFAAKHNHHSFDGVCRDELAQGPNQCQHMSLTPVTWQIDHKGGSHAQSCVQRV